MKKKEAKKKSGFNLLKEKVDYLFVNFPSKKFLFVLFGIGFLFIILGVVLIFVRFRPSCGDGTFYNECSKNKPYFCSNGTLIEKASVCNCSSGLFLSGDSCNSQYQEQPKEITLKYVLRGEEKQINLILYKKMADYLSNLPSSISSNNGDVPSRADFKYRNINNTEQKNFLMPLVVKIQNLAKDKTEQMRIAVSTVQEIPFGNSEKTFVFGNSVLNYSRYPYEVLYDLQGVCGEKSELLIFLLRELGYNSVFFFNLFENHESVGIKCPRFASFKNTGYCFVETTGSSIITDDEIEYVGVGGLYSEPEVIYVSGGLSLGRSLYEYKDAEDMKKIRRTIKNSGQLSSVEHNRFEELKTKYRLEV